MKLLGLSIVLSLAVGCALPSNDDAHKQSSAQNGANDPNRGGGQELSPPDDDPGNEEGPNTCDAHATTPDGWTRVDLGAVSVAVPSDSIGSKTPMPSTSYIWSIGTTQLFVDRMDFMTS